MKETKIKEKITIAQNSNQSIANTVGAGLVSAQNKTNNKSTANVVGVGALGDPQTKNISRKFIANVVGADDPVRPLFEDQTQNKKSSKTYSNLISNFQSLTSNSKGITLIALIITIIVMLILVGVTVNIVLNGGLIARAQDAKKQTEEAMANEQNIGAGRIEIDGTWYNSLEDYVNDIPSDDQNEKPLELPEELKVGDYIYYTPDKGEYKVDGNEYGTGSGSLQTFVTEEGDGVALEWRILSIDEKSGKIVLVSATTGQLLTLKGENGYNHGVDILNDLCEALYSKTVNGKQVAIGRSMNMGDIIAKYGWEPDHFLGDEIISFRGCVDDILKYPNLMTVEKVYIERRNKQDKWVE